MPEGRLEIGTRVQLSPEGRGVITRHKERVGTITGHSRDGHAFVVKWDGCRGNQAWDVELLEPARGGRDA